jgi:hypothetical protein
LTAEEWEKASDAAYAAIRASNRDVAAIAQEAKLKPQNVRKVKQHLFYEVHLLDKYVAFGVPARQARFDADLSIAEAWKRLENGTYSGADMQLLRHEIAEAWFMKRHKTRSYRVAHAAAERRFPAPRL